MLGRESDGRFCVLVEQLTFAVELMLEGGQKTPSAFRCFVSWQ